MMSTLYKIYTAVLANKLRLEVKEKGLISSNQIGFRKGMRTANNIFVLNYLINRQIARKGGKVIALFVDLRTTFDSVYREELIKAIRHKGVREGLVERVEMLGETRSKVRCGGKVGKGFWVVRRVRQGCPLSPLFNILIADLEDEMSRVKWGGVKLGEDRIYSLSYTDDTVLLADDEGSMRNMLERLERYLDGKSLEHQENEDIKLPKRRKMEKENRLVDL